MNLAWGWHFYLALLGVEKCLLGEAFKGPSIKDIRITQGEGGLGKPDIYCYFQTNSIVKPGQTGEGGLEILVFVGRP